MAQPTFSPCDCPADAPKLVRGGKYDVCKAVELGQRDRCPLCCDKIGDMCVQKGTQNDPCEVDRRTNAFATTLMGRIREDGAVSMRVDLWGRTLGGIVDMTLGDTFHSYPKLPICLPFPMESNCL